MSAPQSNPSTTRSTKTLVLSLGSGIATVGVIILGMVLSRQLSKPDWATYRQTMLVFTLASPFLALGLSKSLYYFLPTNQQRNRGVLLECLGILLISGMAFLLFIVLGGNRWIANLWDNPALQTTLLIIAPIAIFQLLLSCAGPCLISSNRVSLAAAVTAGVRITVVVSVLLTAYFHLEVTALILANVIPLGIGATLVVVLMLIVCRNGKPTISGAQAALVYGVPLGLGTMITTFSRNIDRSMIGIFQSPEEYAVFDNGAIELPLISIITGSMTSILLVDYRKMLDQEQERPKILPLLHRAMLKSGSILIPAMMFLMCMAPEFMVCMWGEKYRESAAVFRVYLLMLPMRTFAAGAIGMAAGKTRELAVVPLVALVVNVLLNLVAIRLLGAIGCALATVIVVYLVSGLGRIWIARSVLHCSFSDFVPWSDAAKLAGASMVALPLVLLIRWQLQSSGDLLRLAVTFVTYMAVTTPLLLWLGMLDLKFLGRFLPSRRNK